MSNKICINGEWGFMPIYQGMTPKNAMQNPHWEEIIVPSSWRCAYNAQGAKNSIYDIFCFPHQWNDAKEGLLKKEIIIENTVNQRVFLYFEAIAQSSKIYMNGKCIHETQEAYLPIEVEITDYCNQGKNEIIVYCGTFESVLNKEGREKCLVPNGTWYSGIMRGIWQDAYVIYRNDTYIADYFIHTLWRTKTIEIDLEVEGTSNITSKATIIDRDGNKVLEFTGNEKRLVSKWENPIEWNTDNPYLYRIKLEIFRDGILVDDIDSKFGFREVWNEKHKLYVNGTRVNLRGDSWHFQGLAQQTKEYALNWCRLAKESGVNLIRPHGMPYSSVYLEAADEAGIFIFDESAIYGSSKSFQADHPKFIENCKKHIRNWIRRDRNHPSVIIWSIQNEMRWVDGGAGYKEIIPELMEIAMSNDPSRRLISCDGDNRLLKPEMIQAQSMHYNIDGRICDWDKSIPLTFGEHGKFHYISPVIATELNGQASYLSYFDAMKEIALQEKYFIEYARKEEVTGISPFNMVYYQMMGMPSKEIHCTSGEINTPGVKSKRIIPYSLTLNNGLMKEEPLYITTPAYHAIKDSFAPIAIFSDEYDNRFYDSNLVERNFSIYNDTFECVNAKLEYVLKHQNGGIISCGVKDFTHMQGERESFYIKISFPAVYEKSEITLNMRLRHNGELKYEKDFVYYVYPKAIKEKYITNKKIIYFGESGEKLRYLSPNFEIVDTLENIKGDLLIIGENTKLSQKELQPKLKLFSGKILILEQKSFALGNITLSKRPFFTTHMNSSHEIFNGIAHDDLKFWGKENYHRDTSDYLIKNAFNKPSQGKILAECGEGDFGWGGLLWASIIEFENVLMTQIRVMDYFDNNPVSAVLLNNMVRYLGQHEGEKPSKDIVIYNVTPKNKHDAERILGCEIKLTKNLTYQLQKMECDVLDGVSNADLCRLDKVTYGNDKCKNVPIAQYSIEVEGAKRVLTDVNAPWEDFFVGGKDYEAIKVLYATKYYSNAYKPKTYGVVKEIAGKRVIILQIDNTTGDDRFKRIQNTVDYNLGKAKNDEIFTYIKQSDDYNLPYIMTLTVDPAWDYEQAVEYHSSAKFFLNNLGEGEYGMMKREVLKDGAIRIKNSTGKKVFATLFIEAADNHNPEQRKEGEIPDPSIVPNLLIACNRNFNLYINGIKFEETELIEDTILNQGLNRMFFEFKEGDEEITLSAAFKDKFGEFLNDLTYIVTLD